jgi:hypothetical protein
MSTNAGRTLEPFPKGAEPTEGEPKRALAASARGLRVLAIVSLRIAGHKLPSSVTHDLWYSWRKPDR